VTKDFRLGSLGHPWEQTLCVYGEDFLPAYRRVTPLGNEWLIRQRSAEAG
jgi:hypothetical protein